MGTECEYALFHQLASPSPAVDEGKGRGRGVSLAEHLKQLSALLVAALNSGDRPLAGEFLGNGGRFYIDRGSHPEYATPECRRVRDLIAHEKAGDRIVQELVEGARLLMVQQHIPGQLQVFKNNLDSHGNTYGSHENYLIAPQAMAQIQSLIPFLLTRQIFAGAGKLVGAISSVPAAPGCIPFRLSQRADFIDRIFSDRTSETRGIINTRKREIRRQGENLRLHVILGDSNLSEYALGLKVGTTSLVLRLLEEGGLQGMPMFLKPVEALKQIACVLDSVHDMEEGSVKYTALDIQSMYLDRAQRFFATHAAGSEEKELLALWERTLTGLKGLRVSHRTGAIEDDPGELKRKLDWVTKLWLLHRTRDQRGLAWDDPHLRHLDFKYHDLNPERGLFERCASLQLVDRLVDEEQISRAQREPPRDTRAWLRGTIVQEMRQRNVEMTIKDWESIRFVAKGRKPAVSVHPFDRQRRLVNSFKADLQDPFESRNPVLLEQISQFVAMWEGK